MADWQSDNFMAFKTNETIFVEEKKTIIRPDIHHQTASNVFTIICWLQDQQDIDIIQALNVGAVTIKKTFVLCL